MKFDVVKADKNLFAVYQTIYSNADIEMWFDWHRRLEDTKWTDECFFLTRDGQNVGGAILTSDSILYPFLIPPYSDRMEFWRMLLQCRNTAHINGVLAEDCALLPMFGYRVSSIRQVMCRPADEYGCALAEPFRSRPICVQTDMEAIGKAILAGYSGGIDCELFGEPTLTEAIEDAERVLNVYAPKDLSHVVVDAMTDQIAGICLAGIGADYVHGYAEIADICVLPQYRGRGIAKHMISKVLSDAYGIAPFVKLCVTVGNPAEFLYRQMGFQPGPRFANLVKRA